MSDVIKRLRAAVPTYEGTPIAWPCEVRSELLLEAAAEIERQARERDEARAEVERLRAEMLELAEWCEAEEPLSHKKLSYRLRYAQEAKP